MLPTLWQGASGNSKRNQGKQFKLLKTEKRCMTNRKWFHHCFLITFFFMWAFCFHFCLSSGIKSLIRLHNPICFSGPLWWCNKENHECHSGARSAESHLWPWLPELWTVGCSKREERLAQHLSFLDANPWSSFPFWTQTWLVGTLKLISLRYSCNGGRSDGAGLCRASSTVQRGPESQQHHSHVRFLQFPEQILWGGDKEKNDTRRGAGHTNHRNWEIPLQFV